MPLFATAESLDERELALHKYASQLRQLEEQIKKDGENLYKQALERVQSDLNKLAAREAELAPKEALLKDWESRVSTLAADTSAKELDLSRREALLSEDWKNLMQREETFGKNERRYSDEKSAHEQRVAADLASIEQRHQQLSLRDNELTQQQADTLASLRERESEVSRLKQQVDQNLSAAIQDRADAALVLKKANADIAERYALLKRKEDEYQALLGELSRREQLVIQRTLDNKKRSEALDKQGKLLSENATGLDKSKLDIEVKELDLQRRESLLKTKMRKFELEKEAAK